MKNLILNTLTEFHDVVKSRDLACAITIFLAIKSGIKKKYKSVNVFNVTLKNDPLSIYQYKLEKDQWDMSLNNCMEIFSSNEMFEECTEIQQLLKKLKK